MLRHGVLLREGLLRGIKTSSYRQARASAVRSVKRPSPGCNATGKKRRFRTLQPSHWTGEVRPTAVIRGSVLIVRAENNVLARAIHGIISLEEGPKRFASEPDA